MPSPRGEDKWPRRPAPASAAPTKSSPNTTAIDINNADKVDTPKASSDNLKPSPRKKVKNMRTPGSKPRSGKNHSKKKGRKLPETPVTSPNANATSADVTPVQQNPKYALVSFYYTFLNCSTFNN